MIRDSGKIKCGSCAARGAAGTGGMACSDAVEENVGEQCGQAVGNIISYNKLPGLSVGNEELLKGEVQQCYHEGKEGRRGIQPWEQALGMSRSASPEEQSVGWGCSGQEGGPFWCQEIARTVPWQAQLSCPCATMSLGSRDESRV